MENATDAIKMGFAVLVFVSALSIAVFSFSRARQASAQITEQADAKEYYERISLNESEDITWSSSSRVVGVETVIPTLYRYYKENYTVVFYRGEGYNSNNGTFTSISKVPLYYTETTPTYLKRSSLIVEPGLTNGRGRAIFGFDKQDEQARNEPWNATELLDYNFIKAFINGNTTEPYYTSRERSYYTDTHNYFSGFLGNGNSPYYTISFQAINGSSATNQAGLIGKDYKFVERFGEYNYNNVSTPVSETSPGTEEDPTDTNIISNITSSVDILENDEIVNKRNGTIKRVIQYIYIAN